MTADIRVFLVDDNAELLDALKLKFAGEPGIMCAGSLPSAEGLLDAVRAATPNVLLLDIEMPGPDAFDAARELAHECPEVRTLILSAYVEDEYVSRAVEAGIWGYVSKAEETDVIIECVRRAARGEFTLSPKALERCRSRTGREA